MSCTYYENSGETYRKFFENSKKLGKLPENPTQGDANITKYFRLCPVCKKGFVVFTLKSGDCAFSGFHNGKNRQNA